MVATKITRPLTGTYQSEVDVVTARQTDTGVGAVNGEDLHATLIVDHQLTTQGTGTCDTHQSDMMML